MNTRYGGRGAPRGMLHTAAAVATLGLTSWWTFAHAAGDDGVAHSPHEQAAHTHPRPYTGLDAVRATWTYRRTTPARENLPAQTKVRRSATASTADGRFGNVEHQTIEGQPTATDQFASYFVYGEGRTLWCAYAEGSRYTETTFPNDPDILDPAPQFCLAPWARLGAWLDEFERRGITPTPLATGVRYEIAGAGREGVFAVELGPRNELTAVEFGLDQARLRWEYSDFHDVEGRPIPRRLRDFTLTTHDGKDVVSGEGVAMLESFEANTPAALEAVRFNPQQLNVRYFDEATGEVFSPDRSQKLFTINEGGIKGGGLWSRRAWVIGVAAAAGASLWFAWKKWRQGH